MNKKDAQILAQVAAKAAADLYSGTGDLSSYLVARQQIQTDLLEALGSIPVDPDAPLAPAHLLPQQPAAPVAPAAPQAPAPVAVATQNLQQGGIAVTPVQPQTDDDFWLHLVNNRDDWWDNRDRGDTTIFGGNSPDFRSKSFNDKNGKPKSMFLVSRRFGKMAPDFVFQALGIAKPSLEAQPVAQATAPAPQQPPVF